MQCNKLSAVVAVLGIMLLSGNAIAVEKKDDDQNSKTKIAAEKSKKKSTNSQEGDRDSSTSSEVLSPTEMEKRGRAKR